MSLYPELETMSFSNLVREWKLPAKDGEDYARAFFSEVALAFRKHKQEGIDYLLRSADTETGVKLASVIDGLSWPPTKDPRVKEMLFRFLNHRNPSVVAAAIDALRLSKNADLFETMLSMLSEQAHPIITSALLRYVAALDFERAQPYLLEALSNSSPLIRESAIDELSESNDPAVIPYIEKLLNDSNPDVREAARSALS